MRDQRIVAVVWGLCVGLCVWAPSEAATFDFGDLPLTVPDGFVVEQAAGPPLVERPVTCAFDEAGRLYVTESSGSNAPLAEQQKDPQHRVLRLEDTDGDGVFDRRTVFAEGLMMLQGSLWHRGSLYVAAAPEILKLTDTDGDGVADRREVWHDGGTLTGCGNDLHGPYLAPNGRIEFTKGAFAEQVHDLPGRPGWTTRASHVFRCRPDGSDFESVLTGGMDNPVDVAFTATGERLLSATFLVHPAGGHRDGVVHGVYGGVFGKDHGVLDGHARTGDLLPVLIQLGPAAACGLHVHSGFGLGSGLGGDAFACSFNLRCVTRHRLSPDAGSFRVEREPFLSGDSADFHPTDVIEDADGSLLVVDTGGWYKLCCPTSQLEKPAVTGAIYRIRREADPRPVDPRGALIDFTGLKGSELVALLADSRPAVAQRAVERLADLGAAEVVGQVLRSSDASDVARLRAVWCLARIESEEAKAAVRTALGDPTAEVRQAAAHVAGLVRDAVATGTLVAMLQEDETAVARAAAEALGRIGGEDAVSGLLRGAARAEGRILEHSITYALIEAGLTAPLEAALTDEHPRVQRMAMVALDQLPVFHGDAGQASQGPLQTAVAAAMRSGDPTLQDAGLWILSGHPEWASEMVAQLDSLLDQVARAPTQHAEQLIHRLAPLAGHHEVAAAVVGRLAQQEPTDTGRRLAALRLMLAARPDPVPDSWIEAVRSVCMSDGRVGSEPRAAAETEVLASALKVLDTLPLSEAQRARIRPTLFEVAERRDLPTGLALQAVRGARGASQLPAGVIHRLLVIVQGDSADHVSPLERSEAVDFLSVTSLSKADRLRLAGMLHALPAADVARLLPPLTEAGGSALTECLQSLAKHPRPDTLPRDLVAAAVERARADVPAAGELLASIDAAVASQRQRFHDLVSSLPAGDPQRGHRVFLSAKAACTSCHAMAYAGGRIGPDLTRIGSIRTEADLLESIVLPSASFVRSYEPVVVLTTAGTVVSGIASDEQADRLVVQTSATASEVIPRDAIDTIQRGDVSLMPSGYDMLLSPQELADLVAFLARAR